MNINKNHDQRFWFIGTVYGMYVIIANLLPYGGVYKLGLSVLLLLLVYLTISVATRGVKRTVLFLLITYTLTFVIEHTSIYYGVPFGYYRYTDLLGLKLLGVPVVIPLIWSSILFISYELGGPLFAPVLATFIDVGFDPVFSRMLWHWLTVGQYYGVPISNFIGWYITSMLVLMVYYFAVDYGRIFKRNRWMVLTYTLFGVGVVIVDYSVGLYAVIIPLSFYLTVLSIACVNGCDG